MIDAAGGTHKQSPDSDSMGVKQVSEERQQIVPQLRTEIELWQGKIDAAKLQVHLGTREARDRLRPHVERLEQEMARVDAAWEQLEESSEGAWKDKQDGLKISLLAIQRSFEKAKKYFDKPDDS